MRSLLNPRSIPADNPIYFQIEVEGRGTLDFKLPFPLHLVRVTEMLRHLRSGVTEDSKLEAALDIWIVGGAAIGLCWNHSTLELDSPSNRDLKVYGEAVLNEMHEAGWSMSEIGEIYSLLFRRILTSLGITKKEVDERVGFSKGTEATL